jgi:hypothetical protein
MQKYRTQKITLPFVETKGGKGLVQHTNCMTTQQQSLGFFYVYALPFKLTSCAIA